MLVFLQLASHTKLNPKIRLRILVTYILINYHDISKQIMEYFNINTWFAIASFLQHAELLTTQSEMG